MMWEDGDHVWISENRFYPADVHWEWTKQEKVRRSGVLLESMASLLSTPPR